MYVDMCVEKGRGGCGVYVGAAVSTNNLLRDANVNAHAL